MSKLKQYHIKFHAKLVPIRKCPFLKLTEHFISYTAQHRNNDRIEALYIFSHDIVENSPTDRFGLTTKNGQRKRTVGNGFSALGHFSTLCTGRNFTTLCFFAKIRSSDNNNWSSVQLIRIISSQKMHSLSIFRRKASSNFSYPHLIKLKCYLETFECFVIATDKLNPGLILVEAFVWRSSLIMGSALWWWLLHYLVARGPVFVANRIRNIVLVIYRRRLSKFNFKTFFQLFKMKNILDNSWNLKSIQVIIFNYI